jgi:hypothetical protein
MSSGIVRTITLSRQTTAVSNMVTPTAPPPPAPGQVSVSVSRPTTKPPATVLHRDGGAAEPTVTTRISLDESRDGNPFVSPGEEEEQEEAAEEMAESVADAAAAAADGHKTVTFLRPRVSVEDVTTDRGAGPAGESAISTHGRDV